MDERLPWKPGSKIYRRRKRRATQLEMLLVEHEMAVNELKYESRLEFGTGSKLSEATVWKEVKKIFVDGLPPKPSTPKPTPRSQQNPRPNARVAERCGNYFC